MKLWQLELAKKCLAASIRANKTQDVVAFAFSVTGEDKDAIASYAYPGETPAEIESRWWRFHV